MYISIHPQNPQERLLNQIVDCLRKGGIIIYPTDTVYGLGCDITNKSAIEKICRIKKINPEKAQFACICEDFKYVGEYTNHVSTTVFKMMKRVLPGPFTFILEASKNIPRHFQSRRKTVGIRVVNHKIPSELVRLLGNPIMTTSLPEDEALHEYITDAWLIHEKYEHLVDYVIDGGEGGLVGSTIVDCSQGDDKIMLVREGAGILEEL